MHLRRDLTIVACLSAAFAGACREIVDPPLPDGTQTFTPPSYYTTWWAMTSACSGVSGDLAAVQWYVVPAGTSLVLDGAQLSGYWSEASNRIVLRDDARSDGAVVRHEMLHALIRVGGHPRQYFIDRCGGTVDCVSACIADAGPAATPPAATPQVPADSFDLAVVFGADTVSATANGGYLSVTVTATNRASHPVIASLPLSGDVLANELAFGFLLASASGGSTGGSVVINQALTSSGVWFFAAGETKRQVFDVFANDAGLKAGQYRATGSFGLSLTSSRSVTVVP